MVGLERMRSRQLEGKGSDVRGESIDGVGRGYVMDNCLGS